MNYKIHVSAFIEETQQLMVSFSSDETERDAADYPAYAHDISVYGECTAEQVLEQIAKTAPIVCADIVKQEKLRSDDKVLAKFHEKVGQTFEYAEKDLFPQKDHSALIAPSVRMTIGEEL